MKLYRTVAVIRVRVVLTVKCVIIIYCWWSTSLLAGSQLTPFQDWKSCGGDNLTGMGMLSRFQCPSSWHKSSYISHPGHQTILVTSQTALNYLNYAQRKLLNSNESCLNRTLHNLPIHLDPTTTIILLGLVFQTQACLWTTAMLTVSEFRQRLIAMIYARLYVRISAQMLLWHRDLVEIHRLWHCEGLPQLLHQVSEESPGDVSRWSVWPGMTWTGTWRCPRAAPPERSSSSSTSARPRWRHSVWIRLGGNCHYLEKQRCERDSVLLQLQLL